MKVYSYNVGSNGFNQEGFEQYCDSLRVIFSLSYGEPTAYGQTLKYNLRIPGEVEDQVLAFINDAPNRLLLQRH